VDRAAAAARANGVPGRLVIRLAPWPEAPLWIANKDNAPSEDRILIADAQSGAIMGDYRNEHLPAIPRLVALGVHLHQGDFGPVNLWVNTAFALSLVWLVVTGIVSWWSRRPPKSLGIPPKARVRWPRTMIALAMALCVLLPIFAASLVLLAGLDRLMRFRLA
jgi:uncharacterized iron-regulated membrane protein